MKRGSTLFELLVTLALMAVVASVVTLALRPRAARKIEPDFESRVADARRAAISARRPVTVELSKDAADQTFTAFPDGRVVGGQALNLDLLTGEKAVAHR